MRRLDTELLGLQIVARETASIVGEIDGLIVDDARLKVAGFLVDLGLYEARVLPFEAVLAIGEDAVVVEGAEAVLPITSEPRLENLARKEITISFARAITKSGRDMGTVGDFLIDTETGNILGIEVLPVIQGKDSIPDTVFVSASGVHKLGRDVVVFSEDAEQHVMVEPAPLTARAEPVAAEGESTVAPTTVSPAEPEEQLEDTVTDIPAPDLDGLHAADETATAETAIVEDAIDQPTASAAVDALVASVPADTEPAPPAIGEPGPEPESGPAAEAPPVPATPEAPPAQAAEVQPRHFLLGKRVVRRIEDTEGGLIADAGDTVSYEMIQHAKASDQLLILSLNVE